MSDIDHHFPVVVRRAMVPEPWQRQLRASQDGHWGGSSPSGAAEPRSQGGGTAARPVRVRSTSLRAARRMARGEGTAQPPLTRGALFLVPFFWASKKSHTPEGRKKQ